MPTTDLKLDERGTLPRPGPLGRLVRLGFGVACLYYGYSLFSAFPDRLMAGEHVRPLLWNGSIFGLIVISYVINIGFSRAWKKWPAFVSVLLLGGAAGYSQITAGSFESQVSASVLWIWLLYIFSHLGTAFLVSGIIGTPGCEMRAFHDLWTRLTGNPTKEHYCPIGPLNGIDNWESKQAWMRQVP